MKTLEEIKTQLELLKPTLRRIPSGNHWDIWLAQPRRTEKSSDIDILVTFTKPNTIDLIDFIELEEFLSQKLGSKIDLVTKNALKPMIKDQILRETIYA